eukprot:Colp12_sorted_trinity150504_noHs@30218
MMHRYTLSNTRLLIINNQPSPFMALQLDLRLMRGGALGRHKACEHAFHPGRDAVALCEGAAEVQAGIEVHRGGLGHHRVQRVHRCALLLLVVRGGVHLQGLQHLGAVGGQVGHIDVDHHRLALERAADGPDVLQALLALRRAHVVQQEQEVVLEARALLGEHQVAGLGGELDERRVGEVGEPVRQVRTGELVQVRAGHRHVDDGGLLVDLDVVLDRGARLESGEDGHGREGQAQGSSQLHVPGDHARNAVCLLAGTVYLSVAFVIVGETVFGREHRQHQGLGGGELGHLQMQKFLQSGDFLDVLLV